MLSKSSIVGYLKLFGLAITLFILNYWDIIFQYKIIGNAKDSVHLIGPVFKKINMMMLDGHSPLWIQEILCGVPFYNNAMFSFTYPLYLLGTIDYGNDIQILRTISLLIVFHLLILYISNIILLSIIGFDKIISIVCSFCLLLCLNTAYNSVWIIAIAGYAYVPLFLAGIIAMFKYQKPYLSYLLLGVGSIGFLAKPAQTAILAVIFGTLLTIIGLVVHKDQIKSLLPKFLIAALLVIGINLPGLVQLFLEFADMMRFTPNGPVQGNSDISIDSYRSQVDLKETINYLLFKNKRVGVGHPWAGPMAIFAFIAYPFIIARSIIKPKWVYHSFFAFTIITIVLAFGKELPTFWMHYNIPILNKIREATRFLFITNIGFSVLLAFFTTYIKQHLSDIKGRQLAFVFLCFSITILTTEFYLKTADLIYMVPCIVLGILTLLWFYKSASFNKFLSIIVAITICYTFLLPNTIFGKRINSGWDKYIHKVMRKTINDITPLIDNKDQFRMVYHDSVIKDGEWANAAMLNGFRSFQGNTVVMPINQFDDHWHKDKKMNYRSLWGGKWHIVNNKEITDQFKYFEKIYSNKHYSVFENEHVHPRAWFANHILPFDSNIKRFINKLEKKKKLRLSAFVTSNDRDRMDKSLLQNNCKSCQVIDITYSPNVLSVATSQPKASLLVFNEYYSPNWRAYINDNELEILKVNVNQMGVIAPEGKNLITLKYQPKLFPYFILIQKLCFALLLSISCYLIYISTVKRNKDN